MSAITIRLFVVIIRFKNSHAIFKFPALVLHGDKKEELKHHCDMCQRKFAEKRMLLLHLEAVHKKVKPYLCNYCGNSFASKSTLNLHIRKHTAIIKLNIPNFHKFSYIEKYAIT
ncbi:hypothetical protein Avbf_12226 [Armadillidium vulgare]|nr:hypothetical protein Avbf_12226 [Armadillidium vulgare]